MRHFAWRKRLGTRLVPGVTVSVLTTLAFATSLIAPVVPARAAAAHVAGGPVAPTGYVAHATHPVGEIPGPVDWTPVDPSQLQPNVPFMAKGPIQDPLGPTDADAKQLFEASLHVTNLMALDALPAPTSGRFKVNPSDKLDVVRMKKNGGMPVIVALPSDLTPSTVAGVATEYTVWYKQPNCYQPPANWDPGAATQATRNLYGYPPLHGNETAAQYDARVSWMKTRICEFRMDNSAPNSALHATQANRANRANQTAHAAISGNNVHHFNNIGVPWSGNFADEPCVEATLNVTCSDNAGDDYRYQDVYAYWTWKGISGTNNANGRVSQWMGEGGMTANPNSGALPYALVQSGSENEHDINSLYQNWYQLFVEYETSCNCSGTYDPWGTNSGAYGEYVYAEEYSDINGFNAYSTIGLPNDNLYYTTNVIKGNTIQADPESAEAIVEDASGSNIEFSTMTFNGIGVLATGYSSNAQRMDVVWHDYCTYSDSHGQVDAVGPITTDNNYSPNDDNAITWQNY